MSRPRPPARRRVWAIAAVVAMSSCAVLSSRDRVVRPLAGGGGSESALERIGALDTGESRLLYLYERGLILHASGDFRSSNEALDRAEALWEDLYTRSLLREAGSLVTGDYLLEYRGERFEAALVHYYKIMNFLALDDIGGAAVECRKLNHLLQRFQDEGGSFYTDDPFLQYLTGLIYALAGERVDAGVSLRVALDGYRRLQESYGVEVPSSLPCDLAANARGLGRRAEAETYAEGGSCLPVAGAEATGSLRLFLECGHVPVRVENRIAIPIYAGEAADETDRDTLARELAGRRATAVARHREVEYLLQVALPSMAATPSGVATGRIRALPIQEGSRRRRSAEHAAGETWTCVAANPGALALRSFHEKEGEIAVRAVARSLARYVAHQEAKKKHGRSAAKLVNLVGVVTEVADTRCWTALPEKILMGGLDLAPGRYRIEIELIGASGRRTGFASLPDVEIRRGRTTILNYRSYQ